MASTKVRPKLKAPCTGKVIRIKPPMLKQLQQTGPYLNRLTVVWVQTNGVTFNTTGFFARVFRGTTLISTAAFDRFGVVQFSNIPTLTTSNLTIRTFNAQGFLFRTRTIPAGSEAFAIIG